MADPRFHVCKGPFALAGLAGRLGVTIGPGADPRAEITDVAPLAAAGPGHLSFLASKKHSRSLAESKAGAVLIREADSGLAPPGTALLLTENPERDYARAAALFYPAPEAHGGIHPRAIVDPSARLEAGVEAGPGAVIGSGAEIGTGTVIGPNTVIGDNCAIGRQCRIGANVTIAYALIGDRVTIHPSACIGQDGFGFAMGAEGHLKIPQLGRVIIQDDVEIGAATTIDRGSADDTVIGEGTKIDNLVMVAHNCRIGRHCVVVGQVGLSGSTVLEDYVVLAGQVGIAGHLTIGAGTIVVARSGVSNSLPAGGIYGGAPAKPVNEWKREIAWLSIMAKRSRDGRKKKSEDKADDENR
jgi:UDP-3-O-[3-hydroxymyristoyl] glucosamine N-acyltransferase